ncbi:MAG: PQQ-binding-like beta-propeller repeat protein, partial [Acidobacteria bacterium]|nr:PQQ-binding-like beta-propeller repeat protein [Acidobacteriota bacterium]
MKNLLVITTLVAAPALLFAQNPSNYAPSGPSPLGPGDPEWRGETVQTGTPPPETGGLDQARITRPLSDEWTSYSGDLTGKRYSALKLVNRETVKYLSLKWITPLNQGCGPTGTGYAGAAGGPGPGPGGGEAGVGGGGRGRGGFAPTYPIIAGGLGNGDANTCGPARIGGGILMVDGRLYAASPNNVFAIDARDGAVLWHNYWKTRGGTTTGTRGPGMLGNMIYFSQHDDWVVALDARNGKEVWRHEVAPFDQQYFSSNAPMAIKGHLLVGTGNDLDAPAFLKSLDPQTGAVRWILYSTPQKEGDPGLETWASLDAAKHGNGATWIPGAYDPETNLYIYGTGNPTPAYTQGRGEGENLFTGSLLAVNVDTGKIQWYFQTSPHDTHDWDSTQTPVIVDAPFRGRMRKLLMTAMRNGYFFVLDRTTGEHLVTSKVGLTNVWAQGIDEKGRPKRNLYKDAQIAGTLVNGSVLNYPPPTFSPDTGLFYVHENSGLSVSYLMEPDPRGSMGLGGIMGGGGVSLGTSIVAVDYRTGRIVWRKKISGGSVGLLSTAGGLLFLSNGQNVEAWDAATGKGLWYSQIGGLQSPPETFMLDGKQHLLFSSGGSL